MESKKKRSSFSGQIGFVLAAAGSAVGLGNIWRFPYLAAKDGGGLFLLVYVILVLTFGFTLLTSDLAIGRKTKLSSIYAYDNIKHGWKFLGILTFIVPALIMTYYAVIGGWIVKYFTAYVVNDMNAAAKDDYFGSFITSKVSPIVFMLVFMALTSWIVYSGVEKGIERISKIAMPIIFFLVIGIAIFALTLNFKDADGTVRTGIEGLKIYCVPNFKGLTVKKFLITVLDAMGQLFFSLSVSMGIMITYGSYVKDEVDLGKSITQIEVFDTLVAFLAGMMIIPAVYTFMGKDGMAQGPSLIFVSLPKVFKAMGPIAGRIVGIVFFLMVGFAALTSCISVLETLVANCMELFKASRKKVALILSIIYTVASIIICLGYNVFYFELKLPNDSVGQLLDIMDYISNYLLMPIITLLSAILIGWVVGPKTITDEVTKNNEKFSRKPIYVFMVKFVIEVVMVILILQAFGLLKF